jgi:hypothetical protein
MAFVRFKRQGSHVYYYLCHSYREHGKVRTKVLRYLGRDPNSPEALLRWWTFLGQPPIPYKPGETIFGLERFLAAPCRSVADKLQQRELIKQALLRLSKNFHGAAWQLSATYT